MELLETVAAGNVPWLITVMEHFGPVTMGLVTLTITALAT
jgi:hypothetical protein